MLVTKQQAGIKGTAVTWQACSAGGDTLDDAYGCMLLVQNTDSAAHDCTLATQEPSNYGDVDDIVVTVAAGTTQAIGPLSARVLNAQNEVLLTYSAVTGMQLMLLAL